MAEVRPCMGEGHVLVVEGDMEWHCEQPKSNRTTPSNNTIARGSRDSAIIDTVSNFGWPAITYCGLLYAQQLKIYARTRTVR